MCLPRTRKAVRIRRNVYCGLHENLVNGSSVSGYEGLGFKTPERKDGNGPHLAKI